MQLTRGQKKRAVHYCRFSSDISMIPVFLQGWLNRALRIVTQGRASHARQSSNQPRLRPPYAAANRQNVQSVKLLLGPNFT